MYMPHQPIIALPKGTLLNNGRYRIERELNRGGTAVVYAAEDLQQRVYVALKVMNGPDQVPIKVVKREITFSSSMHHSNIVRLLDVFAEKHQLIIVWELIHGPDLLDLLNECGGRLPEDMAAFYFAQLLQAVLFMHANGFCHRDIKPENCMVQRSNCQLKLIDFGLSKHLESARTLGVGTPDYMSPEMLQHHSFGGRGNVGMGRNLASPGGLGPNMPSSQPYNPRAVDAWAMGVLMYLLVTGKYPFEDPTHPNNLACTINNVLAGRCRPLPETLSQGCRNMIMALLQIKTEQRSSLEALASNAWLNTNAMQYAQAVGHPELINLSKYHNITLPPCTPISGELTPAGQGLSPDDYGGTPMEVDETASDLSSRDQQSASCATGPPGKKPKSALHKMCSYIKKKLGDSGNSK